MRWLTTPLLHARRAAAFGVQALCALALAACAVTPGTDETSPPSAENTASAAGTPTAGAIRATKGNGKKRELPQAAAQDTPAPTGSWNLFSWSDDDEGRDTPPRNSLEGLRADMGTFEQRGEASWYGKQFHGRKTANGERFDMGAMTAAHPSLPLDSWVLVRNLRNDKVAVLRINDRGPYHGNRVLDVSYKAAKRLGFVERGSTRVEIRRLSRMEVAALGPLREPGMEEGATDGGGDGLSPGEGNTVEAKPKRSAKARKVRASAKRKGH